jgi:hypothetical protein
VAGEGVVKYGEVYRDPADEEVVMVIARANLENVWRVFCLANPATATEPGRLTVREMEGAVSGAVWRWERVDE